MRKVQSLNGKWDYRIGEGKWSKIDVPFSSLCVGVSECALKFVPSFQTPRAFLVFEGITYRAWVNLNGKPIGELAPYIEHRIEITDILNQEENILNVKIQDIGLVFGPSAGWENYSGIIRNVYIEYENASVISDAVWHCELSQDFKSALCTVKPEINSDESGLLFKALLKNSSGETVGEGECQISDTASFEIENPKLWSPDSPQLYTLECCLFNNNQLVDRTVQKVGFKKLYSKGRRFYLNGQPIFLLGVNRHDIFGDKGHTLSEREMQKDMRMIKEAGCNFVRLVHYPHNKRIIEIADEIGLLVSEEPGLWWSDMKNPEICRCALEVLEGVIKRDRNHPSIAFWLSFNECDFTLEFLKDSAAVARKNDPYRMVSGANCMNLETTKENFLKCGFDFYTMHPYSPLPDKVLHSTEFLSEMPLLFTEWGGYHCHDNPNTFRRFIRTIVELAKNPEDKPCLGGAVFWQWANTRDYNRGAPPCKDGILCEGLVDADRNKSLDLEIFTEEFSKLKTDTESPFFMELIPENAPKGDFETVEMPKISDDALWAKLIEQSKLPVKGYLHRDKRQIEVGPMLETVPEKIGDFPVLLLKRPMVICENAISVDINCSAKAVYIIGNTSMPEGYPISGEYGEKAVKYIINYSDGGSEEHIMKNGVDISAAPSLLGSSRINPTASNSNRIMNFGYKKDWEQYIINLRKIETNPEREIENIKFISENSYYNVLVYGVTIEK